MFGIEHGASIVPSDAHLAAESMQLMWRGAALLQTPAPSSLADVVAEAMARKRAEEHEAARQQEMARCADVAAAEAAKVAARRGSESRDAAPCDYAQASKFQRAHCRTEAAHQARQAAVRRAARCEAEALCEGLNDDARRREAHALARRASRARMQPEAQMARAADVIQMACRAAQRRG